jgi:hypothetical protein
MKMILFNGCFVLPPEFTGDLNDALLAWIEHNKAQSTTDEIKAATIELSDDEMKSNKSLYRDLMDQVGLGTGKKSSIVYSLSELNKETSTWTKLNPEPEQPTPEPKTKASKAKKSKK